MQPSFHNPCTRFLCCLACSAALCFTSAPAYADQASDVASILDLLEQAYAIGWFTIPWTDDSGVDYLADFLARGLFLNGTGSPYGALVAALLGGSVNITTNDTQNNAIGPTLRRVEALLRARPSVTNELQNLVTIQGNALSTLGFLEQIGMDHTYRLSDLWYAVEYMRTNYVDRDVPDAWNVHLHDDQWDALEQMFEGLQHTSGTSGDTIVSAVESSTRTNAAILADVRHMRNAWDDADTAGEDMAADLADEQAYQDQLDADLADDVVENHLYATEPDMPTYTVASDADTADVDRDNLLDNLQQDGLTHGSILSLLDPSDFITATGVQGSMEMDISQGRLGDFVRSMSTITTAGWYGLLACMSACLFWRKQNEISGIVRGTNFSRV